MIDTRVKRRDSLPPIIEYTVRREGGGRLSVVVSHKLRLKLRIRPVGNLNFGQFSSASRPKVARLGPPTPKREHRLWEPISPGYGSHGAVAALFHPFSYYTHPCKAKRAGSTLTPPCI